RFTSVNPPNPDMCIQDYHLGRFHDSSGVEFRILPSILTEPFRSLDGWRFTGASHTESPTTKKMVSSRLLGGSSGTFFKRPSASVSIIIFSTNMIYPFAINSSNISNGGF
ncbi:MAG: hypothetical protein WC340_15040, partial [Kiritimatiellia bacterium]